MTFANWITILRILLIPVFVGFAIYYGRSVQTGSPETWLRVGAVSSFVLAAISDALDGFIARRFNQMSKLGRILDPIADKGLLFAAVITLSLSNWHYTLPIWFVVMVISRDVVILGGCALLHHMVGHLEIRPSLLGKACTASQMTVIALVLLQSYRAPTLIYEIPVFLAGGLTLLSGLDYLRLGIQQLTQHGHAKADPPRDG